MSIARNDDRRNADLAEEIARGFNETMASKQTDSADAEGDGEHQQGQSQRRARFIVTGDQRDSESRPG